MKKHPGFLNTAKKIAKREGITLVDARRELASATRNASAKAKRLNPRLNRVKG